MPTIDLADDASQEATDMLTFLIAARGLACGLRDRETSEQLRLTENVSGKPTVVKCVTTSLVARLGSLSSSPC